MKEQILKECRGELQRFSKMTDSEIYDWLCGNYWSKDYEILREISLKIFHESRS